MDLQKKSVKSPSDTNCNYILVIKTIIADKEVLLPICIIKGLIILF